MAEIVVSFLLPTRGRPHRLLASLQSLGSTCSNQASYEVVVRSDFDDFDTQNAVLNARDRHVVLIAGGRGRGYLDLHLMVNQAAAVARGEFLVLWNDDALMLTTEWDKVLKSHLCDLPYVYKCRSEGNRDKNIFPIVRRSIYETMGHFSESALNDFYMSTVAQQCSIEVPINIDVKHDHPSAGGNIFDQTFQEAVVANGICKYDSRDPRILECIAEDVVNVKRMLSVHRVTTP